MPLLTDTYRRFWRESDHYKPFYISWRKKLTKAFGIEWILEKEVGILQFCYLLDQYP